MVAGHEGKPGHERLPRESRLRGEGAFARVYAHRKSASDGVIVLYGRPRPPAPPGAESLAGPRLGLSVSRKVGNAVRRNRWKRRIREAYRRIRGLLPQQDDFVVVARPGEIPSQEAMERAILALAHRVVAKRGYADAREPLL